MLVFTDFTRVYPVTITPDRTIDYALHKMKNSGVRLLIVVDKKHRMIGLITADKIMGGDPVRLAEDRKLDDSQITVAMLMQPQRNINVLELSHLRDARVGHIVATLHRLEQKYVLVVDDGIVKGMFSACIFTIISMYSCQEIYIGKSQEELSREMFEVDSLMKTIQLQIDSTAMDFNKLYIDAQRINNGSN